MTDRDNLYRAILADPHDDTPRLVYADWLQENGRAEEAEFIRIQCQIEAITPDHPDYQDLSDRQEELRLWLGTYVVGPKLKLSAGLTVEDGRNWWGQTRRGFPRFLEFNRGNRHGLKPIRALAGAIEDAFAKVPTRWLVVRYLSTEQLAELLGQPVVSSLDCLTVQLDAEVATDEGADVAARLVASCPRLANLRDLTLAFPLGEAGATALAESDHLARVERLNVDGENLTGAAIRAIGSAGCFRGLKRLDLGRGLPVGAFVELCQLEPFPSLHSLQVHDVALPVEAWVTFARSRSFPQLTDLDLGDADMGNGNLAALVTASGFRLTSLDLAYCSSGDEARALLTAPWFGSLRSLNLANNRLGPGTVGAIAGSRKLTELKHLSLADNVLGVRGLRAIAANRALRGLTKLDLSNCDQLNRSLSSTHYHEFLTALDLPRLRDLDLSDLPIGARGARLLARERFGSLVRLRLSGCGLSDAAVAAIVNATCLQNLIELNLINNGLGLGVKALTDRRVMPLLAECGLGQNRLDPDLAKKLSRRRGFVV